jgi:hypothetical protein
VGGRRPLSHEFDEHCERERIVFVNAEKK